MNCLHAHMALPTFLQCRTGQCPAPSGKSCWTLSFQDPRLPVSSPQLAASSKSHCCIHHLVTGLPRGSRELTVSLTQLRFFWPSETRKKPEGLQTTASAEAEDMGDAFKGRHLSWGDGSGS